MDSSFKKITKKQDKSTNMKYFCKNIYRSTARKRLEPGGFRERTSFQLPFDGEGIKSLATLKPKTDSSYAIPICRPTRPLHGSGYFR